MFGVSTLAHFFCVQSYRFADQAFQQEGHDGPKSLTFNPNPVHLSFLVPEATIWENSEELYYEILYNKFQASKPSGSEEEDFWIFFYVFLWFEPRTPRQGAVLDPATFIWTKLEKNYQAMLHIEFQASKPNGPEEEDFWIFSYDFLWSEPRTPWHGAILDPETFIWIILVKDH